MYVEYYLEIGTIALSSVLLNCSLFITLIMREKQQVLLIFRQATQTSRHAKKVIKVRCFFLPLVIRET